MIKVYKIKIGEKVYEVEVEAVSEKEGKIEVSKKEEKKEEKPVVSSSGSETKVEAPLQGLVLSIEVNKGDTVKSGQNLVIIEAMKMAGVKPVIQPIRGGTDGAMLSFRGLPCPNLFAGGHNFHGKLEYVPLESMEKAIEVVKNIVTLAAK